MYTSNNKCIRAKNVRSYFLTRTTCGSTRAGFTLIELLVVIAIISLLLTIIVPALRIAKEKGAMAVCLYNVRQFSTAWFSYQEENKGKLVHPNIGENSWVMEPLLPDEKTPATNPITDEDEQRGIEKGTLFPYIKAYDVYHCPGDNKRKSKTDGTNIFRTYAIPNCLGMKLRKYNEIKTPGIRYNFVEEADCRGYNQGTWDIQVPATVSTDPVDKGWRWQDPIGVNHGSAGVLGFCDGHAETHKWEDPWTKERVTLFYLDPAATGWGTFENANFLGSRRQFNDLNYMGNGWADRPK